MKTRVQKWGNSLALRIPRAFADEVGLESNTEVEVTMVGGKLVVTPVVKPKYQLKQLLTLITEENTHREVDMGAVLGNESW